MNGLLSVRVWCPWVEDEPEHPNAANDEPHYVAQRYAEELYFEDELTVHEIHVRGANGVEHVFDVEATMTPVFSATRRPS